jgi:hypothetical protein
MRIATAQEFPEYFDGKLSERNVMQSKRITVGHR